MQSRVGMNRGAALRPQAVLGLQLPGFSSSKDKIKQQKAQVGLLATVPGGTGLLPSTCMHATTATQIVILW